MSGHRAAELLLKRLRISLREEEWVGLGRPFFMAQSDTHGDADKKQFDRTQTPRKLSTKI